MQWKLPRRSRWAERYHEWAMRRGFPVLVRIAPRWPRGVLHLGARIIIGSVMAVYPGPKREIERNLRRILGPEASRRRVRRARRRMIHNFAYYWVDLFHFCLLPYEETRKALAGVRGLEHLQDAAQRGRGVILLTAHLGNWEVGGVFMREQGLPVSVVYVPDQSPHAEGFRDLLRRNIEIEQIAIDPRAELSSLPVLRALKAGRVVALQGDRDFNERGEWVDFFSAPAPFPLGPMMLARLTGAALIPTFIVYNDELDLEVELGEPIEVAAEGDRHAAARRALERWVAALEEAVRRWPTQWYTFYHFWQPPEEQGGEAAPREAPRRRREAV